MTTEIDMARQRMTGPHSTPEATDAALGRNTILRCQVGSGLHGVRIEGTDDRDEMGVCLEPPQFVIGLAPHESPGTVSFEQYIYRTQPEGGRSGPGDIDLVIYSARKWVKLALNGNPTVLLPLFAPATEFVSLSDAGHRLLAMRESIISKQAGDRFRGYLHAQRMSMLSHEGKGRDVTRPELIEAYGFDTKYAAHMVRLGLQGLELMRTGKITLPVPEPERTWLLELRQGKHSMQDALDRAESLEEDIRVAQLRSPLREEPDRATMDHWLILNYTAHWDQS